MASQSFLTKFPPSQPLPLPRHCGQLRTCNRDRLQPSRSLLANWQCPIRRQCSEQESAHKCLCYRWRTPPRESLSNPRERALPAGRSATGSRLDWYRSDCSPGRRCRESECADRVSRLYRHRSPTPAPRRPGQSMAKRKSGWQPPQPGKEVRGAA